MDRKLINATVWVIISLVMLVIVAAAWAKIR